MQDVVLTGFRVWSEGRTDYQFEFVVNRVIVMIAINNKKGGPFKSGQNLQTTAHVQCRELILPHNMFQRISRLCFNDMYLGMLWTRPGAEFLRTSSLISANFNQTSRLGDS